MSVTIGAVLKAEMARLWQACCQEQGIDPQAHHPPFGGYPVAFEETSPLTAEYNRAVKDWLEYEQQREERRG